MSVSQTEPGPGVGDGNDSADANLSATPSVSTSTIVTGFLFLAIVVLYALHFASSSPTAPTAPTAPTNKTKTVSDTDTGATLPQQLPQQLTPLITGEPHDSERGAIALAAVRAALVDPGNTLTAKNVATDPLTDNRFDIISPSQYRSLRPGRGMLYEFKVCHALGLPCMHLDVSVDPAQYVVVHTLIPWGDTSGGAIKQMAYSDFGMFYRIGERDDSAWQGWKRVQLNE